MKWTNKLIIVCVGVLILVGYYKHTTIPSKIPKERPKVTFKYKDKVIPSNMGEHTWFNIKAGGNSYIVGRSYDVGLKTSSVVTSPGSTMEINFSYIPKNIELLQWTSSDTHSKIYDIKSMEKKYEFALPLDKGEYIFEVMGQWDETHNTSDIIRVNIN